MVGLVSGLIIGCCLVWSFSFFLVLFSPVPVLVLGRVFSRVLLGRVLGLVLRLVLTLALNLVLVLDIDLVFGRNTRYACQRCSTHAHIKNEPRENWLRIERNQFEWDSGTSSPAIPSVAKQFL